MVGILGNEVSRKGHSPKSGYRRAAENKQLLWRRNLGMIAMNLEATWEISA